jgi:hypothetical protein
MEVHHRFMVVRILPEPRMRILWLWCELILRAHLAWGLLCRSTCSLLLSHHVFIAILGVVLLVFISMFLAVHTVHVLTVFLVA